MQSEYCLCTYSLLISVATHSFPVIYRVIFGISILKTQTMESKYVRIHYLFLQPFLHDLSDIETLAGYLHLTKNPVQAEHLHRPYSLLTSALAASIVKLPSSYCSQIKKQTILDIVSLLNLLFGIRSMIS